AYTKAENAKNNDNASLEELTNAKTDLENSISSSSNKKDEFDNQHRDLVNSYSSLKTLVDNKSSVLDQLSDNDYAFLKNNLEKLYTNGESLLGMNLQDGTNNKEQFDQLKSKIEGITSNLESSKQKAKDLIDGKFYPINENLILPSDSTTATNDSNVNDNDKTNNIYTSGVSPTWKYAVRRFKENDTWKLLEHSKWIYKLGGEGSEYKVSFENYSSNNLKLIFPYKIIHNSNKNNTVLKIKLNDINVAHNLTFNNIDDKQILLAQINLTNVKFGQNTLSFSVDETDKVNPLIGNMYLTSSDDDTKIKDIVYKLNGQSEEVDGKIKIDISKAVGGSTRFDTYFEKIGSGENKHTILKRVGKYSTSNAVVPRYTLAVYVPEAGNYNVGITYNQSNYNSNAYISVIKNNGEIQYSDDSQKIIVDSSKNNRTDANGVKTIEPTINNGINTIKLNLSKGWNNLAFGKGNNWFPNLEYLYLKKDNSSR
ncbi:hypothetical protein, partial [Mycoplasma bradburyae]|uniref:hypothetical protein n=1 Tax=Mycoplasma bradburyae TaxID=2963128 RepID=UPI0023422763